MNKQLTLAANEFERFRKPTRRERFLAEMQSVVPWGELVGLIEPFYPKASAAGGRPANTADCKVMDQLLHGQEGRVYGDQAYKSQTARIRAKAPGARDFTNRRCKWKHRTDEAIKAENQTKSRIRARVEHSIGVIKRVFGFCKVHYSGLAKNGNRLSVTAALANIFMARYTLLGAVRPQ